MNDLRSLISCIKYWGLGPNHVKTQPFRFFFMYICLVSKILRVYIEKEVSKLKKDGDIMIDQLRAIDNKRLIRKIGKAPKMIGEKVKENLRIILDI